LRSGFYGKGFYWKGFYWKSLTDSGNATGDFASGMTPSFDSRKD